MIETQISLENLNDVKAFVNTASKHTGDVTLFSGKYIVDGKSIMGVFSLDLSKPIKMEIEGSLTAELKQEFNQYISKE